MYMACRHIKTNGLKCQSPALKGRDFCYYHSRVHTVRDDVRLGPLQLPVPEDPAAIQISVARINEAVLRGYLDLKRAQLLLTGLKLAAQFINRKELFDENRVIQSVESDARGDEIAPRSFVCDEDDDCESCPYAQVCPRCGHPGDDDCDEDDYEEEEDDEEEEEEDEEEDDQEDEDEDDDQDDGDDDEEEEDDYDETDNLKRINAKLGAAS